MKTKRINSSRRSPSMPQVGRQWWALPAAFLATVLALPVNAGVEIPTDPLTSEKRLPPNIVFILDDSSSMGLVSMPASIRETNDSTSRYVSGKTGLADNPSDRSYVINTIYYDPTTSYRPWVKDDGTSRFTGGTSVDKVYTALDDAAGSGNSVGLCGTTQVNPNQEKFCDLRGSVNSVFYMPNAAKGYTGPSDTNASHYDRYNIRTINGVAKMGIGDGTTTTPSNWNDRDINAGAMLSVGSITVPADSGPLTVTAKNGSGGNADLYVRFGGYPTATQYDDRGNTQSNSETVTIDAPAAGVWYIGVRNAHASQKVDNEDISASVLKFLEKTPTGRNQDDELTNFATWYSYYRTRIKAAKGGASEAFASLGREHRIGFTAINGVKSTDKIIPIDTATKGEFYGPNKATFFSKLQGAPSTTNGNTNTTPLRPALKAVGEYYKGSGTGGPWGPGVGNEQFSCRQNFAILTTDGYWTSGGNGFGNEDGNKGRPYQDSSSDTLADVAYHYWANDLRDDMDDNVPTSTADGDNAKQHMNTFTVSIGLEGNLKSSDLPALISGAKNWPALASSNNGESNDKIDDLWHAAINGRGDFVIANNPTEFTNALKASLATINGRASSYSNVAANSVSLDDGTKVFNASYVSGAWTGNVVASSVSEAGVGVELWAANIPTSRTIKTWSGSGTSLVDFPTASQKTALGGADVANYIKGDQSKEKSHGGDFRDRSSLLGDIVGSSPAYVKETDTLYVGANDGMLHAFDANNGEELFAYVPTGISFGELASLSSPEYLHRFFVDGPITVSTRTFTAGKNILVGALGKGGKGLYALDVYNPDAPVFKWELKDTAGSNMGLVMSKPIFGNVPGGKAVIVGNGINSSHDKAVLVIVKNFDTASPSIVEIDTGEGSSAAPNGLSAPTGVYGTDGKTLAYVYAGDMLGNVWKFDLKTNTAKKLFAAGATQPISGGVTVATDPKTRKRWVFLGTGRYLLAGDAGSVGADTQSMYGFIEDGITTALTPSDLVNNTPSAWTTGTVAGKTVRAFKQKTALPANAKGWLVNLPTGERIVQDAQIVSTFLITASMIPSSGSDPCKPDGNGYINALDAFTGTSAGGSYFDLDGNPNTNDKVDGQPIGSIDLGNGMPTLPSLLRGLIVAGGTGGASTSWVKALSPRWDRVSWREVRSE